MAKRKSTAVALLPIKAGYSTRPDLPGEQWRDIAGYEGCYQVSNLGRIYSLPRIVDAIYGKRTMRGRFMRRSPYQGVSAGTLYFRVFLQRNRDKGGGKDYVRVAVLVWEAFRSPIPHDHVPSHLDGDPSNCALDNLVLRKKAPGHNYAKAGLDAITQT